MTKRFSPEPRRSVEHNQGLRIVLTSLNTYIAVLDKDGIIIAANEAWEQFAQANHGDVPQKTGVGTDYLEAWRRASEESSQAAASVLNGLQSVLEGTQTHFTLEYRYYTPSQHNGFLLSATRLYGEHGGAVVSYTDITDRTFTGSQLAQAQKMARMGQLTAAILHEFNTPTQYIGDNIRFLQTAFQELSGLFMTTMEWIAAGKSGAGPAELAAGIEASMEQADVEYLLEEIPRAIQEALESIARLTTIVHAIEEFPPSA
jgi:signal transduction histidine kinase